jgi:L-asparagine transporter-like permease
MAIAALLATASSVNSNIFAGGNLTLALSELTQFPPIFGSPARFRGTRGVTITVALVLILSNVFDLSAIASLGSAVSLIVFLVVGLAGLRLRGETGSKAWVIVLTMVGTAVVLVLFGIDTARNAPETFAAIIVLVGLAIVLDAVWKHIRRSREGAPDAAVTPPAGT